MGVTLLIGVRVKAKVWALARRDAHSFLAMWTHSPWEMGWNKARLWAARRPSRFFCEISRVDGTCVALCDP